jgi:Leucine-rich repeat (LRR) protein
MADKTNDDINKSTDFYGSRFLNKKDEENNDIKTLTEETIENNNNLSNLEYQRLHFFCKECHKVPKISFQSYEIVNYYCDCHEIINQPINNILSLKIIEESNFKPTDFLACPIHKENYIYFCNDCKTNVCRKCIRNNSDHKDHILQIFDEHFRDLDDIVENILTILKNNNDINIENLKRLMNAIINDYKNFPNYSHFYIIRQCYFFLTYPKRNDNKTKTREFYFIKNISNLNDINIDLKNIKKISLPEQGIKDISQINFAELINLTELNLSNNSLTSIEPLSKYKLPNLKILNLAVNLIDNSNKEYFKKLDFPELTDFNIYENRLTDYEILQFNNNNNLPKLKLAFFGGNIFKFPNKNKISKELKFEFSSVIEIGFKKNVFNDTSINLLPFFILTNLEIIYLQENNLTSLNFVENLELPFIKEFWLYNNLLTDFMPLKKYKTLERIEMKNNKVNNLEELDTFIKYLPKLKKFNLIGNCIKYDFLIKSILELAEEKNIEILISPQ